MQKLTKDMARKKLQAAKKAYGNNAMTFNEYLEIKKEMKKVLMEPEDA